MESETLATEILHEIKLQSKRYFIIMIIAIIMLFSTNLIWLYAWTKSGHNKGAVTSYDIKGQGESNVVYSDVGGVEINGEGKSK